METACRHASPEHVLDVLRYDYQTRVVNRDADGGLELSFQTPIAHWIGYSELLPPRKLWPWLNELFGMDATRAEWLAVLEPTRSRTLGDLCRFVAARARFPVVTPSRLLGGNCLTGGAFLTLRALLKARGVPVEGVRPSTPLGEFARLHGYELGHVAALLAPGTTPPPKVRMTRGQLASAYTYAAAWLLVTLISLVLLFPQAGRVAEAWDPAAIAIFVVLAVFVVAAIAVRWTFRAPPAAITFGDLADFADLSRAIAAHYGRAEGRR